MANLYKLFKTIKEFYKLFKETESQENFNQLDDAVEEFLIQFDHYVDFVLKAYKKEYQLPVLKKWYSLTTCLDYDNELVPQLNAILKEFDNGDKDTISIFDDVDYCKLQNLDLKKHVDKNCYGCNEDTLVQGGYCQECGYWNKDFEKNILKLQQYDDDSNLTLYDIEPPSEIDIVN